MNKAVIKLALVFMAMGGVLAATVSLTATEPHLNAFAKRHLAVNSKDATFFDYFNAEVNQTLADLGVTLKQDANYFTTTLVDNVGLLDQYARGDFPTGLAINSSPKHNTVSTNTFQPRGPEFDDGTVASATSSSTSTNFSSQESSSGQIAGDETVVIDNSSPDGISLENYLDQLIRFNLANAIASRYILPGTGDRSDGCLQIDENNVVTTRGSRCRTGGGGGGSSSTTNMAIGSSITSATEGSVLFAGPLGVLAQDNTNFAFDDTSNNLTVGGDIAIGDDLTVTGLGGSGTRCLQTDNNGLVSIAGAACGAGGGQTPWTSNIDADGFALQDALNLEFRTAAGSAPAGTVVALFQDNSGDLTTNVLTGKTFNVAVNGTDEYNFSSTTLNLNSNTITNAASYNGLVVTANTGVITTGTWNGTALTDAFVSDTLTASNFVGSGSTSNAVDLATTEVNGTLGVANGGTNAATSQAAINNLSQLTTEGDILYHNGTNSTRLARGSNGECLTSNTTTIVWGSCGGGGSQTPWTSNIDAGGFNLQNAGSINATSYLLAGTDINTAGTLTNVAYENQANNFTSNQTVSVNGAASTSAQLLSGTWFTGGTGTTTKPQLLIEPAGATSTAWSTSGTGLGINAASGFTGNLLNAQLNGANRLALASTGALTLYSSGNSIVLSVPSGSSQLNVNGHLYVTNGGNTLFGGTSSMAVGGITPIVQVQGSTAATSSSAIEMFNTTAGTQGEFMFYRSKNASVNTATVVASGDGLGKMTWYGAQQTGTLATQNPAAQIRVEVDGTVTSGAAADMPGRIIFATTPDGSGTLADRLTINNAGNSLFGGNLDTASADLGNGTAGYTVTLGRNTNATNTGAGSINFQSKAGTAGYVWQDNAGNLRINTAAPSNANDTAGVVVGDQTSTRSTKQDIEDYTDFTAALQMVADAPLHTFRYIKDVEGYGENSPLAKERIGYIADEVPGAFMWGNSIDQVSVNGILMASVKALNVKIEAIPAQTPSDNPSLPISQPTLFNTAVVMKSHLYLSEDSVGQAKILAGDTEVRITFSKPYEYQPIVTLSSMNKFVPAYIKGINATGFTIAVDDSLNSDAVVNWHAFASSEAKLTVSNGTTENIILGVGSENSDTDEPVSENAPFPEPIIPEGGTAADDETPALPEVEPISSAEEGSGDNPEQGLGVPNDNSPIEN